MADTLYFYIKLHFIESTPYFYLCTFLEGYFYLSSCLVDYFYLSTCLVDYFYLSIMLQYLCCLFTPGADSRS